MAETHEPGRLNAGLHLAGAVLNASDVNGWFVREVLPLEAILMTCLRQHWPNKAETDPEQRRRLRQEHRRQSIAERAALHDLSHRRLHYAIVE